MKVFVRPGERPRHIVVDATGLKVYGSGEWHVRKHRTIRRRTWRKPHLGVDETTKEIVAVDLTASNVHDGCRSPDLLRMVCGRISIRGQERIGMDGRPAFFREASDICDQSV